MWFEKNFISELENLQGLMDDFFRERESEYLFSAIPVNIYQKQDNIFVVMPIAGIPKENISLDFQNGYLTVKAKKEDKIEDLKRILRKERKNGEFARNIKIDQAIDPDSLKAKYEHGFLIVELTKKEEAKARKIQID